MKIILHDYYNNNSYINRIFQGVDGLPLTPPSDGHITKDGLTIFLFSRGTEFEQRIAIIESFNRLLTAQYGCGLSAVTCAVSDCSDQDDFESLFREVKSIDPQITTIEIVHGSAQTTSASADCSIQGMNDYDQIKATILGALKPIDEDRQPPQDWAQYINTLNGIWQTALKEGNQPHRHDLKRQPAEARTLKSGQGG